MAEQSKNKNIKLVLKNIIEKYEAIIKLKKNELNIEKIELFTIFYKLYNLSIQYAILLIRAREAAAGLKSNTETKEYIKNILRYYYKYQDLKENIDIIKRDLEEKIKKNNSSEISDFKNVVEESEKKDSEFKSYCSNYQYNFYNNTVKLNGNLVSSYSNNLQFAYDEIIKGNSGIISEYYGSFYDNYIKLMEELDKVKNFKIKNDIDKIKKGLYVKKLKIDELLTNKTFKKKIQANSIKIPIKIPIKNLNKYNLQYIHMDDMNYYSNKNTKSLKNQLNQIGKTDKTMGNRFRNLTSKSKSDTFLDNITTIITKIDPRTVDEYVPDHHKKIIKIKSLLTNFKQKKANFPELIQRANQIEDHINEMLQIFKTKEFLNNNMNRLNELELSGKMRELTNKEKLELRGLLKNRNNKLKNNLSEYEKTNTGVGVFGTNPIP